MLNWLDDKLGFGWEEGIPAVLFWGLMAGAVVAAVCAFFE